MTTAHTMARLSVTSAAALLIIVQVASGYVVPEVLVMRMKRNPEPMRSFSFSGFNPNGQMAAFTGAAEYPMFGNYGPPPQAGPHYGSPPAYDSYGSPAQDSYGLPAQDSYGPPSGADHQASVPAEKHQYGTAADQRPQENGPKPNADSKEQNNNNSVEQPDNNKQYRGRDGPSSNAEASFNAWFPIMFGVFPNGAGGSASGQSGNTAGRGNNNQGQDQGYSNGGYERSSGTTVIANSVSNGRHGVATSHAIAYGNPRSSQK